MHHDVIKADLQHHGVVKAEIRFNRIHYWMEKLSIWSAHCLMSYTKLHDRTGDHRPWPPIPLSAPGFRGKSKRKPPAFSKQMGLSVSAAIRLLLTRIAREKAVPFDVKVPNEETIAAMEQARHAEGKTSKLCRGDEERIECGTFSRLTPVNATYAD